jgi:hypothetical protein
MPIRYVFKNVRIHGSGCIRCEEIEVIDDADDGSANVPERETAWRSMDSAPKGKPVWVKMGGEVVIASTDGPRIWLSYGFKKSYEWDRANQPTAWQPIQEPLP